MAADTTGLGDTAKQVPAFRPDREFLFGYYDAAHRATVERGWRSYRGADADRLS